MKIALLGYGKMGKVIEKIALERGHEIVLKKSSQDSFEGLNNADVAIDFSIPDAAVQNITACLKNNTPIVSGTTGWLNDYHKMVNLCKENNGAFIYGSNFSLGVNLFFELNDYLAKMMAKFSQYDVSMEEIHHTQKLDKPSGTAISLANAIINHTSKNSWSIENPTPDDVFIDVKRIDAVPGTHSVFYQSVVDTIEIKHIAHNREGFAFGAVIAAEWIVGKKGVFTMKDVLDLK
ncbi:4-hydroxy-tetrahydrodipicolinate reductase [Flavobacterium filum]|uniref:4-hydroxy-tetrahydrodipicolinate reductase n=1 Tax=Flavobacterium TaxID=237 RepID=UPI000407EA8D|nr:4-hydroxy-tetrahydrodipicolinate reductase [Flavobacterium filum]